MVFPHAILNGPEAIFGDSTPGVILADKLRQIYYLGRLSGQADLQTAKAEIVGLKLALETKQTINITVPTLWDFFKRKHKHDSSSKPVS